MTNKKLMDLKYILYATIVILIIMVINIGYYRQATTVTIDYENYDRKNMIEKLVIRDKSVSNSNDQDIVEQQQIANVNAELVDIFRDIFNASKEQLAVDRKVLLTTIKYMIEEREEDDPELIEFVRSLIVKPSPDRKLNLKDKKRTDFSQIGQSKYMDGLLNSKRNGFFVEAGAFDGETFSNSLFFELERGYTGLLIEAIPSLYESVVSKNRNAYVINACIANKRPIVAKFRVHNALTGRVADMTERDKNRIEAETKEKIYAYLPCFSLYTILKAIDVQQIDYFSLDVEGGEWAVLQTIDLKKTKVESFSIEYNGNQPAKEKITNYLNSLNFTLTKVDGQDLYYKKNL